jgi:RimJ/RimL family protein N-acetyltransferase
MTINLRPLSLSDRSFFISLFLNKGVTGHLFPDLNQAFVEEAYTKSLHSCQNNGRFHYWIIEAEEHRNAHIGLVSAIFDEHKISAEIGIMIMPEYQRQGLSVPLLKRFISQLFNQEQVEALYGYCLDSNAPAVKILGELNFRIRHNQPHPQNGNLYTECKLSKSEFLSKTPKMV